MAVVTGAAGKLGPVWAGALLGAGARVVGLDLPSASPDPFTGLGRTYGEDRLLLLRADIRDRAAVESALTGAREKFGATPSILVNNAGVDQPPDPGASRHRFEDIPLELSQRVLEVNVLGTLVATQVFGGAMVSERRGSIVNIGSLYASVSPDQRFYEHLASDPPFLKPPAYGASKAAIVNLTRYLATLWGPHGVRVNALSPGGVSGGQDETFVSRFSARVPLGRMADPGELAGPLLFLASDASSYVTGAELVVDGGFTAW